MKISVYRPKLAAVTLLFIFSACSTPDFDILIKNGYVIDGTGQPGFIINIGIKGDLIVYIGTDSSKRAIKIIDAKGLIVSPGFIDPHTHALGDLLDSSRNQNLNYLTQGVTTVFTGNDGAGPIAIDSISSILSLQGIGTNTALFVGHGTVRNRVMGFADRAPTSKEIERMKALVDQAMSEGAIGISTGLFYTPGSYSKTDEVITLTEVVKKYRGIYDSHIRDESTYTVGLLEAIREVLEIHNATGVPVNISHIKALGVDVWGKSTEVIRLIDSARNAGAVVTADQYPWRASGTSLSAALVPRWALADGRDEFLRRIEDPNLINQIKSEMKENLRRRGGPASILITSSQDSRFENLTLEDLTATIHDDPVEVALDILRTGRAGIASFNMNDEDIMNFMRQPWVMTSSDGSTGHPRKYASYPMKFREYVQRKKILSIEEFVHKSSRMVAETFGLENRGLIKENYFADIVVWDSAQFRPRATFKNPEELSTGVVSIIINGKLSIEQGNSTDILAGNVLK